MIRHYDADVYLNIRVDAVCELTGIYIRNSQSIDVITFGKDNCHAALKSRNVVPCAGIKGTTIPL